MALLLNVCFSGSCSLPDHLYSEWELHRSWDTILREKALMCDSESKQFHLLIKPKTLSDYVSSDSCRHREMNRPHCASHNPTVPSRFLSNPWGISLAQLLRLCLKSHLRISNRDVSSCLMGEDWIAHTKQYNETYHTISVCFGGDLTYSKLHLRTTGNNACIKNLLDKTTACTVHTAAELVLAILSLLLLTLLFIIFLY